MSVKEETRNSKRTSSSPRRLQAKQESTAYIEKQKQKAKALKEEYAAEKQKSDEIADIVQIVLISLGVTLVLILMIRCIYLICTH